jgi:hypothetical protein
LAAACQDGTVSIWNVGEMREQAKLTGHGNDVYAVAFSPDGTLLASGGGDGTARLWNWRGDGAERVLWTGIAPIQAVAFNSNGGYVAASNASGEIRVWRLAELDRGFPEMLNNESPARALTFSPDGNLLAAGDEKGSATLWKWRSAEPVRLTGHRRWVTGAAFTPDGQRLVTAGQDGTVRVWPASARETAAQVCAHAAQSTLPLTPSTSPDEALALDAACRGQQGQGWTEATSMPPPPRPPIPAGSLLPKPGPPVIFYFEALPGSQVPIGEPVLLRWDLANAKEAYLYAGEEESGVVAPEERSVVPIGTTTYRLVARNDQGETERTLMVTPAKPR